MGTKQATRAGSARASSSVAASSSAYPALPVEFYQSVEPKSKASQSWAAAMKQVFEFNPLECPNCKSVMKIVACIHDPTEIAKICKSLGIPPATAPPVLPKSMFRAKHEYDC